MARGGGGKGGYPDDVWAAIVEKICTQLSMATVEGCSEEAIDRCGNNGQLTLIQRAVPDWLDQQENISNGNFQDVTTSHDEAVGEIVDHANYRCQRAAQVCSELRSTTK